MYGKTINPNPMKESKKMRIVQIRGRNPGLASKRLHTDCPLSQSHRSDKVTSFIHRDALQYAAEGEPLTPERNAILDRDACPL